MSERVFEKIDRFSSTMERFTGALNKIPRVAGMLGTAFFAGTASKSLGGDFNVGALGGIVAHDLAHSELPNNQIGGLALGAYFTAIGLLNVIPFAPDIPIIPDVEAIREEWAISPAQQWTPETGGIKAMLHDQCIAAGGTIVKEGATHGLVWCELPPTIVIPPNSGRRPQPTPPVIPPRRGR